MKAVTVTQESAGTAGMTLADRPEPTPAINDVVVRVHAAGFVNTELTWPSTWADRLGRSRTLSRHSSALRQSRDVASAAGLIGAAQSFGLDILSRASASTPTTNTSMVCACMI
jgi:hypothetical protein